MNMRSLVFTSPAKISPDRGVDNDRVLRQLSAQSGVLFSGYFGPTASKTVRMGPGSEVDSLDHLTFCSSRYAVDLAGQC
jgi:hypothetical protein